MQQVSNTMIVSPGEGLKIRRWDAPHKWLRPGDRVPLTCEYLRALGCGDVVEGDTRKPKKSAKGKKG